MKEKKTVHQLRDSLIENYNGLRKDKNEWENFELQEAVLLGQIQILTHVLEDGYFNFEKGKIQKKEIEEVEDKMFTYQV